MLTSLSNFGKPDNFKHVNCTALVVPLVTLICRDKIDDSFRWRTLFGVIDKFGIIKCGDRSGKLSDGS